MNINFSSRVHGQAEDLQMLMKISECKSIISFSGGFPSPELFPSEEINKITNSILQRYPEIALQYGASEGFTKLRESICQKIMNKENSLNCTIENILITSGSQQGLDFVGKLFINKGDTIIVERPTYLGALTAFNAYEPEYEEVMMEQDGMDVNYAETILKRNKRVKFIYTVPDFQNPTGITMSLEKRKYLCFLAEKYNVPIIEDNPYRELIFTGEPNASIKSFDKGGYVVHLGTFSKTFCPGLRIGWVCAQSNIIDKLLVCKQGADLQCGTLNQYITWEFLNNYNLEGHIKILRSVYKKRKEFFIKCIKENLDNIVEYTDSQGGLFTYLKLPSTIESKHLLGVALENGISFVPGDSFYASGGDHNHIRLNYSYMDEKNTKKGLDILGKIIKDRL
ncbi:2-aminoadipate transaminase [Hathewaya proteolytica DSM 3090]|uniref:2-aminoadipate transaminase n=1 Tax=Hathewaya proteolytica DSM 3090 TaxID=1121331 RepID=A0A1M6J3N7_9CLOT|nr:PLP-dependent aminotransferase family protein [Hathewaya proteolytica]SHJ41313.1 2-aminoadipate transaminase [Hathewaya proteolytica DSM 3090]